SEVAYCTTNNALQDPANWGAAGVISGYFSPILSSVPTGGKPGAKPVQVNVFRGYPALQLRNSPSEYITKLPINDVLPAFWLAAGAQDRPDVAAAENFRQLLGIRLANVPLVIIPGGHQGSVWRTALGPMLSWMTPQLAAQAADAEATAARVAAAKAAAAKAAAARKARAPQPSHSHPAPKK